MRCLVTGATGFIGRYLMSQLLSLCLAGDIACVIEPKSKASNDRAIMAYRKAGVRVHEGDLSRGLTGRPPLSHFDAVFHLAANIDTAATGEDLSVNDLGTQHLIDWLGDAAEGSRIVYTSSIAVHDRHGISKGRPLTEASPFASRTEYGITKLHGEEIVQAEAAAHGYTYTILRLATVYGPGMKPGGLFDSFARFAEHGSLTGRLDWPGRTSVIHVDDASSLMIDLVQRPEAANEIFCVANPDAPTVAELAREIGRATGHPVEPIHLPRWIWALARRVACNPTLYALTPQRARLPLWRLSLIVDDGFWYDTSKLQAVWKRQPLQLTEGLARVFDSANGDEG